MRMKRLAAAIMSFVMLVTQTNIVFAAEAGQTDYSNEAFIEALRGGDEFEALYPYGQFEFLAGSMNATEGDRSLEIAVVRKGGTKGIVSMDLKAIDVTAKYGEDYVIKTGDGIFKKTLEANPDARPLVEAYGEVSEIGENDISDEDIIAVIDDATSDSAVTVNSVLAGQGVDLGADEEEAAEAEEAAAEEISEENPEISEGSELDAAENGDEALPKAKAGGLKNARNAFIGNLSDRKDWTETIDTSNSDAMETANDSIMDWAEEMPGITTNLTFEEGEYVKTFTVELLDDSLSESDEQVMFFLSNITGGGELGEAYKSYLNIEDNDANEKMQFEMASSNISVSRADGTATVTIKRTAGTAKFGSVNVLTGEITAKAGEDYEAVQKEVVFPQGVTERTVEIPIIKEKAAQSGLQLQLMLDTSEGTVNEAKSATIITLDSGEEAALSANAALGAEIDGELKQDENGYYKEVDLNDTAIAPLAAYNWGQPIAGSNFTLPINNCYNKEATQTINVDLSRVTKIQVVWQNNTQGTYWSKKKCKKKTSGYYTDGANWISYGGANNTYYKTNGDIRFGSATNEYEVPVSARKTGGSIVFHTKTSGSNAYSNLVVSSVKLYVVTPQYKVNLSNGNSNEGKNNTAYNSFVDIKTWTVDKDKKESTGDSANNAYYTYDSGNTSIVVETNSSSPDASASYGGSITFSQKITASTNAAVKDGVYLAGLSITGSNDKTGFIAGNRLTFDSSFADKYVGNRYTDAAVTVVPVYFPKAAFIYFPQTSGGQVVNHGTAGETDIMKVNRIDTVNLRAAANEGKYVKGFNVLSSVGSDYKIYSDSDAANANIASFRNSKLSAANNLLVADNTGVTWKESDSSVISLRPHGLVTKIEPYYDDTKMIVAVNPKNQYKDKGSVVYIDGNNPQEAGYDEDGSLKTIQIDPMTMGKTYTFNSLSDDDYITKWQDFTGDKNGDGVLSEDENKEALGIDRSAVVGSVYNYIAKITPKPIIYYGFYPKSENSGDNVVMGRAMLCKKAIFGSDTITKPIANATVTVGDLQTQTDANGYYTLTSGSFGESDRVMVNIVFDNYSYNVVQNVNVFQTAKISEYDIISVNTASIYKEVEENDKKKYVSIGANEVENFDSNMKIALETKSASDVLYANTAIFRTYDKNGSLICSDTVTTSDKSGKFEYVLNPSTKGIAPGSTMTVQFADQNGMLYMEHEFGFKYGRYLGTFSILASFDTPIQPVFPLLGAVDGAMGLGLSGKTDDYFTYETKVENGMEVEYKTLSFGFDKEWDKDIALKKEPSTDDILEAVKDKLKGGEGKIKDTDKTIDDMIKEGTEDSKNKKEKKVTANASLGIKIGLDVVMQKTQDPDHAGEYFFKTLMFTVTCDGGFGMQATIPTPIAINIVVGFSINGEVTGAIIISRGQNGPESYFDENGGIDFGDMTMLKKENTDGSAFTFYGYLKVAPSISLSAGVGLASILNVTVTGKANFELNFDTIGSSKGNVTFEADIGIKVLIFKKSWKFAEKKVNMFGSSDNDLFKTNSDIMLASVTDLEKVPIDYMSNRGEWNDSLVGTIQQGTYSNFDGAVYVEDKLLSGSNPYINSVVKSLGDGRYIMVFVDDEISKDEYNYATVKYSIFSGNHWSKPIALDNDGTTDEAPDVYVLDNGMALAAWSSTDDKLDNSDTAITALNSTNIKVAFFDGSSFGEAVEVTHTTAADNCADTQPKFVSGKLNGNDNYVMLYYTKSEYSETTAGGAIGDLISPYSVVAYMFYDVNKGEWADSYSAEDKQRIIESGAALTSGGEVVTDANFAAYDNEWYGQSFADLSTRLVINDADLYDERGYWTGIPTVTLSDKHTDPYIVDSDTITEGNRSIFAYIVDYDQSHETIYDREMFVQVYDFDTGEFSYPIQITNNDVSDSNVKLAGFDGNTYIVWLSNGNIKALNFTNVYENCLLEQEVDGKKAYIVDKREENYIPEMIIADSGENKDISEFTIAGDDSNYAYVLWTESGVTYKDGVEQASAEATLPENQYAERQIYASRFTRNGDNDFGSWSVPMQLTDEQGANYSNLTAFTADGKTLTCVATKGMSGIDEKYGAVEDISTRAIVNLKFSGFSQLELSDIEVNDFMGNGTTNVSVKVINEGFDTCSNLKVKFYGDDELLSEEEIGELASGQEVSAGVIASGGKVKAELYSGDRLLTASETQIDYAPKLKITDADMEISGRYSADFKASVTNEGTADIENADVKIISAATGEVIAEDKLDLISVGETKEIKLTADITDNMFKQSEAANEDYYYCETGDFEIVVGTESYGVSAVRYITNEEHKLLSSVSPVLNDGNASLEVEAGGYGLVYDSVTDDYSALQVKWTSSDEGIASVNSNGLVTGISEGKAVITAYIMPADRAITVLSDGSSASEDIYNEIPLEGIISKTIEVNVVKESVTDDTTETTTENTSEETTKSAARSGGGGSSSRKAAAEAATEADTEVTTDSAKDITSDNANTENTYVFDDVKGTWAENAVTALAQMGIISGVGGNSFAPERNITRAEYVTMLIRLLGDKADVNTDGTEQFADCADGWYSEYVLKAKALGIAAGYENNEFKPNSNMSREEMFAFTERALISFGIIEEADDYTLEYADKDSISPYAVKSIRNLTAAGIITGSDNLIKPADYAKRNEAAQMMYGVVTAAEQQ